MLLTRFFVQKLYHKTQYIRDTKIIVLLYLWQKLMLTNISTPYTLVTLHKNIVLSTHVTILDFFLRITKAVP